MQPENDLRNKRVIVIGGSSRIGLAVAQNAASCGAKIVIASSNAQRLQKAVECIGGEAKGERLDISDERSVRNLLCEVWPIDHLVYTAGDNLQLRDLAITGLSEAKRTFELRYWSVLAADKYGSPRIRRRGSIVLTTGIAGQRPQKGWVIAASVCGTVETLTRGAGGRVGPDSC